MKNHGLYASTLFFLSVHLEYPVMSSLDLMETENIGSLLPVARLGNLALSACRTLRVKWRAMPQCWQVAAVYFSPLVSSVRGKAKNPVLSSQTCPLETLSAKIENSYQTFIGNSREFIGKSTSHVKLFIHDTNKCTYNIYNYSNDIITVTLML
jgi:hypothetical protein